MCRKYTLKHVQCHHIDTEMTVSCEKYTHTHHLHQRNINISMFGLCQHCLLDPTITRTYPISNRERAVVFSLNVHFTLTRVKTQGKASSNLTGVFHPDDTNLLETFRRILHQDILWRQRTLDEFPSFQPTATQRQTVVDLADAIFHASIRVSEAREASGIARRRQLASCRVRLQAVEVQGRECLICCCKYGTCSEKGKFVLPRRLNCCHIFCGLCIDRILRDGLIDGSKCPMCRDLIPSLPMRENMRVGVEVPEELLGLLEEMVDEYPDVYLREKMENEREWNGNQL